jgi:hypothetical protein
LGKVGVTPVKTFKVLVSLPKLFEAVIEKLRETFAEGVPVMIPVAGSIAQPVGSPVAAKLVGLLLASIW